MKTTRRALLGAGMAVGVAAQAKAAPVQSPSAFRCWDTVAKRDIAWNDLLTRLAPVHAVFVGEQHDDPETHRAEAALLSGLHTHWGASLTLAMEMLERDGQGALDDYLAGKIDEATLTKTVALWPNYSTDYRPLVEWARARRVPVLASNVPRPLARRVSQEGLTVLAALSAPHKAQVAAFVNAPEDAYWDRFRTIIGKGHEGPGSKPMDAATARRFYEAQCVKDETMAETVARALDRGHRVLHVNGAFHSDAGLGIPARVLWRRPLGTRVTVITIVPVASAPAQAPTDRYQTEADYVILVSGPKTATEKG